MADKREHQTWTVSAGNGHRDYHDIFLKYGIVAMYDDKHYLRDSVGVGDHVILRVGSRVHAVGVVEGPFREEAILKEVCGWYLPHTRRVKWVLVGKSPTRGLGTRGQRIAEVLHASLIAFANRIIANPSARRLRRSPFPKARPASLPSVCRRAWSYIKDWPWGKLSEAEVQTFVVVPLLQKLGWSGLDNFRIEWKCSAAGTCDIAAGTWVENPKGEWNFRPVLIVEVKRQGSHLGRHDQNDSAVSQARAYAIATGAKRFVVTDGHAWRIYIQRGKKFSARAYFNLRLPMKHYPFEGKRGLPGLPSALGLLRP